MNQRSVNTIAGALVLASLIIGYFAFHTAITHKEYERTVATKGLAEREVPADVVVWPIQFSESSNSLDGIYGSLEKNTATIVAFLKEGGLTDEEISVGTPSINDKAMWSYGGDNKPTYRYSANQTITVYSEKVDQVRELMSNTVELGKKGVLLSGESQRMAQYMYTRLNEIKPEMIEEATKNAREVGEKFAEDSNSELGKIKTASQGLFSIAPRDANTPHIKKVRVVSTVVFYLSD